MNGPTLLVAIVTIAAVATLLVLWGGRKVDDLLERWHRDELALAFRRDAALEALYRINPIPIRDDRPEVKVIAHEYLCVDCGASVEVAALFGGRCPECHFGPITEAKEQARNDDDWTALMRAIEDEEWERS